MPGCLGRNVANGGIERAGTHRPKVITLSPSERSLRKPISVRDPGARSFQALHQPRYVELGRQLQDHVDVVADDAQRVRAGTVSRALLRDELSQEARN
jgi:hypothetical protein